MHVHPVRRCGHQRSRQRSAPRLFPVGEVSVSKLHFGQHDTDSVKRLQEVLNGISLARGRTLKVTGDYDELTRDE